jgi:hypothetical protein
MNNLIGVQNSDGSFKAVCGVLTATASGALVHSFH